MQHIIGIPRNQMFFSSLEENISPENPVRFIDAFVEHLSLVDMGFIVKTLKSEGRPSFDTKVFLKIYLYGYLNGLRSSRKLEKECIRNIELQWLLCGIVPNYHSISDFRKQNPSGLKNIFKLFVTCKVSQMNTCADEWRITLRLSFLFLKTALKIKS